MNRTSQTIVKESMPKSTETSPSDAYSTISLPSYTGLDQLAPREEPHVYVNYKPDESSRRARMKRPLVIVGVVVICTLFVVIILLAIFLGKKSGSENSNPIDTTTISSKSMTSTPAVAAVCTLPVQRSCPSECSPSNCCGIKNDPSTCMSCAHARGPVDYHTLCVGSCDELGVDVASVDNGVDVCQGQSAYSVAKPSLGTTCEASSTYDDTYRCDNVMKDDDSEWNPQHDGAGEWIQLNFDMEYIVHSLEIKGRYAAFSQCSSYEVEFSRNRKIQIDWTCQEGRHLRQYFFQPRTTSLLRLRCLVDCGFGGAQGFKQILVFTPQIQSN